jgi:hypothetical protein
LRDIELAQAKICKIANQMLPTESQGFDETAMARAA